MSKAYLIDKKTGELITELNTKIPTGAIVLCGYDTVEEKIDANRNENLVNAFPAKISRNKKLQLKYEHTMPSAIEINPMEFLLLK